MKTKNEQKEESPMLSVPRNRTNIAHRDFEEYLLEYNAGLPEEKPTCGKCCCRCCLITTSVFTILVLLIFILIFVILPVVFMHSIEMQRNLVFARNMNSDQREFTNFPKYGLEATRNFYVDFNTSGQEITLGVWHVLPLELAHQAVNEDNYNYELALRRSTHPLLLYFHDNTGNRISDLNKFRILRRFFHVIAFDYRSYGDSTDAELTEGLVVQDCVQMYQWLESQTNANIFIWGHSLGASLSTSTISQLRKEYAFYGLFLEAPFTSLKEELYYYPLTKYFAWLPWFEATFIDPVQDNGFLFETDKNILSVDCPILIMHAEDDSTVPAMLSEKLTTVAREMRDLKTQGNVTYRRFSKSRGYGHADLHQALEMPDYIRKHISICKQFDEEVG